MDESVKSALLKGLQEKGWFASQELVPFSIASQLRDQLLIHKNNSILKPAHIGKGTEKISRPDIRGDSILWMEPESALPAEQTFFSWLSGFQNMINEHLMLGIHEHEMHYAHYPQATGYKKHRDCFQSTDQRVLSFVLYLNESWRPEWGGQLALYNEQNPDIVDAQIQPHFAQCAVFLSASIYHEVIFTKEERFSVTGWLKKPLP